MSNESYNFNDIGDIELANMVDDLMNYGDEEDTHLTLMDKDVALLRTCAERLRRASNRHRNLSKLVCNNSNKPT
jgi:hypothetical protein